MKLGKCPSDRANFEVIRETDLLTELLPFNRRIIDSARLRLRRNGAESAFDFWGNEAVAQSRFNH